MCVVCVVCVLCGYPSIRQLSVHSCGFMIGGHMDVIGLCTQGKLAVSHGIDVFEYVRIHCWKYDVNVTHCK